MRAPTHGLAWCGTETGVFKAQGIDVTFPMIEKAGATATYVGLGGYGNIYKALIAKGLSRSSTLEPQRKIGREECSVSVRRQ